MKCSTFCRFFAILPLVFLLSLIAGCQNDSKPAASADKTAESALAADNAPPAPAVVAAGQDAPVPEGLALEILNFGPAGAVKKLNQVVVMFNQPMTPLGAYNNVPGNGLLVDAIPADGSPSYPLSGTVTWLNQYTLAFVPEQPLTGSINLSAAVNPDAFTALSGAKLAQGRQIAISLPPLQVRNAYEIGGQAYDEDRALKPLWQVGFNQNPDEASLTEKAFFVWGEEQHKVPAQITKAYEGSHSLFHFKAKEPLPKNTTYELHLDEGVKCLNGPNPAPAMILGEGQTFGPLVISTDSLANDDFQLRPENGVYISFSNPVRLSEIVPLLNVDNGYDLEPLRQRYAKKETKPVEGATENSAENKNISDDIIEEEEIDDIQTYLYLGGSFRAEQKYTLTIAAEAKDVYGQTLGEVFRRDFRTTQYYPLVRLDDEYGIMETATEPKLPMVVTNLPEVKIEAYAFPPAKAVEFLAEARYAPGYYNGSVMERTADFLSRQTPLNVTLPVPEAAKNGPYIVPVDLKKIFGRRLTGHLLLVRATWKDVHHYDEYGVRDRQTFSIVQVSDLGLALKAGHSSSLIWVTDMARGQGRPGAELEVYDAAGKVLWSGVSDEDGLAELPGTEQLLRASGLYNDDDSVGLFVVAKADGQMAMWNVKWNDGLENWRWNFDYRNVLRPEAENSNWLLNALPLYKPGETAKFKIIARQNQGDKMTAPAEETLAVEVMDAAGRVVDKTTLRLNSFGTASHELAIPPDAALGRWTVKAGSLNTEYLPYIGGFQVLTYRAPAFEIKFSDFPEQILNGDKMEFTASGRYHFGAPVAGQPVRYGIDSRPTWWRLPGGFADYSVINRFNEADEYDDSGEGYSEPSMTIVTDTTNLNQEGVLDIKLDLATEQKPRPRLYDVYVTVTDVDARQVSNNTNFLVHPADLYAGLASDSFVGEVGKPFKYKVIAADLEGRLVPGQEIEATLYRRVWQNVRRKSAGSAYEYVSRMKDIKVESQKVTSGDLPVELALNPDQPGYYWVRAELKDSKGRVNQASDDFYVSGGGPVGWRMTNDDHLTLVPDKKEYQPGDEARIMVQSPFDSGEGLLTVERAGVRQAYTFKIENQTPVLTVPLTEDDSPNVFVSVLLTRGRIADKLDENGLDLGKPTIRLGYTELKVPAKRDLLTVDVTPNVAETGPGGEIEVAVAVRDAKGQPLREAEVAIIAADAAVIQLAGDRDYFPENKFHQDLPLMVMTADNVTSLIGRRNWGLKGANPGGGGDLSAADAGDGIRRNFAALAFFDPQVTLDADGRATVKIKMPENLTTFKIFAVATGQGRKTGTGQSAVLVTRDLLARSALPNYAGVGDEFEAAMVVSNRGTKTGEATVKLTGENFTLLTESDQKSVKIGPGESHEVRFKVKAGPADKASFIFTVSMGADKDSVEFSIPVSPPNQLIAQASYEQLKPGEKVTDLALAEGLDLTRGGLELELSPSLLGAMSEPFDWLVNYPHGCVEQSISKGFGNLVWFSLSERLGGSAEKVEAARQNVQTLLTKLRDWEYGGSYNYWPGRYDWSRRAVYLSAYALDFHLSAREAGFELPDPEIIGRICEFLLRALDGESRLWPEWYSAKAIAETKSYIVAMLSRSGANVAAYIENTYSQRQDLGLFELINLIRAIGFQEKGQADGARLRELLPLTMKYINVTAGSIQFVEADNPTPEIWSSSVRTSSMLLTALCENAPRHEFIPGMIRWLAESSKAGHFGTTQNNAVALNAIATYIKVIEAKNPDLAIKVLIGEKEMASAGFKTYTDAAVNSKVSLADIPSEAPAVTYKVEGEGQAWAALKMKTAPVEADLSASTNGGYIISRAFAVVNPVKGSPGVDRFKRGDVVRVTVTMMVPAPRHATVLLDRVPAGLEPINFNLADADLTLLSLNNDDDNDDSSSYSRYWYDRQEIWPDRVAVYADYLSAGVYTFTYLARAVTVGQYLTPGPQAEEMYAPETFGRGAGQLLTIE